MNVSEAWILEIMLEIRTARSTGISHKLHANLDGMFDGSKRQVLLEVMIKDLREITKYAQKSKTGITLKNIHIYRMEYLLFEFKYIIDIVSSLLVHLNIPHAFTSGGMKSVSDYISLFNDRIVLIY
jgi:hypothetical protein